MSNEDGKRWIVRVVIINVATIIALGLIFYGSSTTINTHQDEAIKFLTEKKADKETVEAKFETVNQKLDLLIELNKCNEKQPEKGIGY